MKATIAALVAALALSAKAGMIEWSWDFNPAEFPELTPNAVILVAMRVTTSVDEYGVGTLELMPGFWDTITSGGIPDASMGVLDVIPLASFVLAQTYYTPFDSNVYPLRDFSLFQPVGTYFPFLLILSDVEDFYLKDTGPASVDIDMGTETICMNYTGLSFYTAGPFSAPPSIPEPASALLALAGAALLLKRWR